MTGNTQFLPLTRSEMAERGWDEIDVLFISGMKWTTPSRGTPGQLLESPRLRWHLAHPTEMTSVLASSPRLCCMILSNIDSRVTDTPRTTGPQ